MRITLTPTSRVLVLTGAGISAESGVPTFRDAGGLWEGHAVGRRAAMTGVGPNAGHRALVALEAALGDRYLLATQNIDGLHEAAGSERIVEMHGNLMRSRCTRCDRPAFADTTAYRDNVAPMCGRCRERGRDALLRPDIVWFGEALPAGALARIEAFITAAGRDLVFVAIGTSGLVFPAAGLVDATRTVGGQSWLVNLERPTNATAFDHVVIGPAGTTLPALLPA